MTPLEKFGAMVLRSWNKSGCSDVGADEIRSLAADSGVLIIEPYSVEKHGEYMRDDWGFEEGWDVNFLAPGIAEAVDAAHQPSDPTERGGP